jgi:arginase
MTHTMLIGAPIDDWQRNLGCIMGPSAYRVAGLVRAIADLGHSVTDWGDLALGDVTDARCNNEAVHHLAEVLAWTAALRHKVDAALTTGAMPIILGGDHALALGSVAGAAEYAARVQRPLYLLWLDAH